MYAISQNATALYGSEVLHRLGELLQDCESVARLLGVSHEVVVDAAAAVRVENMGGCGSYPARSEACAGQSPPYLCAAPCAPYLGAAHASFRQTEGVTS